MPPMKKVVKVLKKSAAMKKAKAPKIPMRALKKGKKRGGVEVNPKSGLSGKAQVYTDPSDTDLWDCELVQKHDPTNTDKFYNMQVLESLDGTQFWTVQHWGRTGTTGQMKLDGPFGDVSSATKVFEKKFKEKAGQAWADRAAGKPFKPYVLVLRGDGDGEEGRGKWQYYIKTPEHGKRIGWYPYTKDGSADMEKYWRQFRANSAWLGTRYVESGTFTYDVNLKKLTQKNTSTGKQRPIRRQKA